MPSVTAIVEWPRRSWTTRGWTPCSSASVAQVWRRPWSVSVGRPYWPTRRTNIALTASGRRQAPLGLVEHEVLVAEVGARRGSAPRAFACGDSRSTATVAPSSAIERRPRAVFGSPTVTTLRTCVIVCTIRTPAGVEGDVSPTEADRFAPAHAGGGEQAPTARGGGRPTRRDCSRNARSVAASHAWTPSDFWPARGGSAASAGLRARRPQRTASLNARWRIVWT